MAWLMKVITTRDGFLDAKSNRRLGKRVIHSDLTEKKLMEVKKVLDIDAMDLDINESHNKSNHVEFQKMGINRDMSTCGMLHSIGSDLTHTQGRSETHQNGSIRSKQNGSNARDYGNTATSRAEPQKHLTCPTKTRGALKIYSYSLLIDGIGWLLPYIRVYNKNQMNRMMSHGRL
ncbi:hypothetical protein ACSBR2_013082 [Camellia fascicularis]